jgi:hypothetical protein
MFALPFVFLNPLYELAVLALVLFFGYLAQSLLNLRRIWFILLMILVVTTILWSIVGSGRTPLFLFVEREALLYGFSHRTAHSHHRDRGHDLPLHHPQ